MNKKITIKDIAKESGVSIATVSYIINNRKDQKISEETIAKVKQIINLRNYRPNGNAQNLSNNRNNIIAVNFPSDSAQNFETKYFMDAFSEILTSNGYKIIYLPTNNPETYNQIAALVVVNPSNDMFYQISNKNFCPVIAVDGLIDDPLFFQINLDYANLKAKADKFFNSSYHFVSYDISNDKLRKHINDTFKNVIYISDLIDLVTLSKLNQTNFVCVNPSLYDLLTNLNYSVYYKNLYSKEKFSHIVDCIKKAVDRTENEEHKILF